MSNLEHTWIIEITTLNSHKMYTASYSPTLLQCLPMPIKKLSGLISRWIKLLQCTYSIRPIIWSANIRTVLIVNRREQKLNRSSSDGPNKSMTKTLYSRSRPYHLNENICISLTVHYTSLSYHASPCEHEHPHTYLGEILYIIILSK